MKTFDSMIAHLIWNADGKVLNFIWLVAYYDFSSCILNYILLDDYVQL